MTDTVDASKEAKWSLIFWWGAAVGVFLYGLWCVYDGWINLDHDAKTFNQIAAIVCFAATGWLVWQGVKESRQIKEQAAKAEQGQQVQGGESQAQLDDSADKETSSK